MPFPTQLIEPIRKTFYNVIQENFNVANRVTYVHRLIYIGEHTFRDLPGHTLSDCMETTINVVNDGYTDERLTGLLVCYPKYFCHIIEGSETTINKHLALITKTERYAKHFGRMKVLVCYHHINQRFLGIWMPVFGKPPSLFEKIDLMSDAARTGRYIYNCVQKLYNLAIYQRHKLSYVSIAEEEESKYSDDSDEMPEKGKQLTKNKETRVEYKPEKKNKVINEQGSEASTSTSKTLPSSENKTNDFSESAEEDESAETTSNDTVETDKITVPLALEKEYKMDNFTDLLPEYGLIEFLLTTPHIQDLYHYIAIYNEILHTESFKDKAWPVPTDFIPMNVFDEPRDPATDLPIASEGVQEGFVEVSETESLEQ